MSKDTEDRSYRKLNVDDFDPEKYDEYEDGEETPGLGPDERSIMSLLSSNRLEDALHAVLQNPPLRTKNQALKDKATILVSKVIGTYKSSEIEQAVKNLSDDEGDLLMKYVYKGMEICPESALCQTLLTWHSQLIGRFGPGTIIRVFSDRQRL